MGGGTLGPVRMCAGCRKRASVSDLLRVVVRDGAIVPDEARRLTGRGANLHPNPECLDRAERKRALTRSLRVTGPLDLAPLRDALERRREKDGQQLAAGARPLATSSDDPSSAHADRE
jgi:predicted RNA-binding protein YlxR (DUF448 family)